MFFLQMSGFPGSGKSTLARRIAQNTGAIVIDHDIVKTALLESLETRQIETMAAGGISYEIEWALIDFHLSRYFRGSNTPTSKFGEAKKLGGSITARNGPIGEG